MDNHSNKILWKPKAITFAAGFSFIVDHLRRDPMTPDATLPMRPVTIGVAGGTGSGKNTVSHALLERVGARHIAYLPHDSYYFDLKDLPRVDRASANFDHPDSLDTATLLSNIQQLQQGEST